MKNMRETSGSHRLEYRSPGRRHAKLANCRVDEMLGKVTDTIVT